MSNLDSIFTPFNIGKCEIKNRVVLCAMEGTNIVDWMMPKGFVKECHDYYIDRAKNEVGLMIPGMTPLRSMIGDKWLHKSPKAFNGVKQLMDEIHSYGSKVFFQIGTGFAGRNFTFMPFMGSLMDKKILGKLAKPVFNMDALMVSASDDLPNIWNPEYKTRALTVEEIDEYVHAYAEVAYLCKQNGVDGVEVHAVHEGYLLDQFTTKYTNNRTDDYGGSLENRFRFATRVIRAIKARCGDDYPVLLRYSVTSKVIDYGVGAVPGEEFKEIGRNLEESEKAVKLLEEAGYDGLNADNGTYDSWYWAHPPVYMPLNGNLKEAEHIKQFTNMPIICAGRMQPEAAAKSISEGKLDGFGVARAVLTDCEYVTKIRDGRFEEIHPCISCHNGCLPTARYKGSNGVVMAMEKDTNSSGDCALNPYTHHEKKFELKPTNNPKNIAVIGGGIGGMEAARLLAKRGHTVDLYEKSSELGGVFIAAAAPSFKEKDKELIEWYRREVQVSGVNVHLNTEIVELGEITADEIIIATGATARKLNLPGFEKTIEAISYLRGAEVGERVVVIGGGLTGCEIAYDLILKGKQPVIVEMQDDILKVNGLNMANSSFLRDTFRYHNTPIYLNASLTEVKDGSVVVKQADGNELEIECDNVVTSIGYIPTNPFTIDKKAKNIHVIGDAVKVGNLKHVVWAAYKLAVTL